MYNECGNDVSVEITLGNCTWKYICVRLIMKGINLEEYVLGEKKLFLS